MKRTVMLFALILTTSMVTAQDFQGKAIYKTSRKVDIQLDSTQVNSELTANNEYLGGAISPGIQMRYTSLNNLTANLPLLEPKLPKAIIGNTTKRAIHSGVVLGLIHEIDGVIEAYEQEFTDLTVILTGGNANFLSKQLKSSIFANSNFLLEGLNYILQFNSKE